jgi:hypothetical protein
MSAGNPSAGLPKKSRKWRFIGIVVILVLALLGFVGYVNYQNYECGFVGCGRPIDEPVILNAYVNQSGVKTFCSIANQGLPQAVVCDVTTSVGTSGNIVLNMTSRYGSSLVEFGNYSSESPYIRFTSTPPCTYPSGFVLNTGGCRVNENGTIFQFNYVVSQSLPIATQVSFTVTVTKTCCWP